MARFSLVGVNGNAFSIMGYTSRCLKSAGLDNKCDEMYKRATTGDYNNLICVCDEYVQMANDALGLEEEEDCEDDW